MKFQALGHACFAVTTKEGTCVLFDPFEEGIGYPVPRVRADIVCLSHDHYDHNNAAAADGSPQIRRTTAEASFGGVRIFGVPCFHDDAHGALRGENIIFIMETDGMRIAHMGDIGHMLSKEQIAAIGPIDVLMIPVGGTFTVDADGAAELVRAIEARVTIPMHYQTARLTLGKPLAPLSDFIGYFTNVTELETDTFTVEKDDGKSGIFVPNVE